VTGTATAVASFSASALKFVGILATLGPGHAPVNNRIRKRRHVRWGRGGFSALSAATPRVVR
jgi:hypothetical protein